MSDQTVTGQQLWNAFAEAYEEERWDLAIERGEAFLRHVNAGGDVPQIDPIRGAKWLQQVFAEGLCRRMLRMARRKNG